jgi:protein arginine N-methyltransferase 1
MTVQTPGIYELEQLWLPFSEAITSWGEDFHALMLDDQLRMVAYHTAIVETIRPGMVVLDLGTGTGILALWALQAGAARVYGLELNTSILEGATRRLSAAGYAARFVPLGGLSYDIELPEPVDLIISEIMGNMGDNEDFIPILADARRRFLKPGGIMLPNRVESYLVPTSAEKAHSQLSRGDCMGLEVETSLEEVLERHGIAGRFNSYYDVVLPRHADLATPRLARSFVLDGTDAAAYELSIAFPVVRPGMFTGFKAYFVASLSRTVALDISGDDIENRMTSDSWKHCYLPVVEPVEVRLGDRIALMFARTYPRHRNTAFRQSYRWEGTIHRGTRMLGQFRHVMRRDS